FLLILSLGFVYYSHRITKWLAYDDEGGYLYAAWRIFLGELPYRDFLTPQLPVFLYPGALVLGTFNYSIFAARLWATTLTLATLALLFLTVRRIWGDVAAFAALLLALVQREIYWAARFFRPEAPMLFWGMLGLFFFALGYSGKRRWLLALSGVALALSTMSKLFGALTMAGVGLFLLAEGFRTRDWHATLTTGLSIGLPFIAVVGAITGLFSLLTPNFLDAVLGHHLRQGSGTPLVQVVKKGLFLYWDYVSSQPVYTLLSVFGIGVIIWKREHLGSLFAWQLPTALSFLLISRGLQGRHLTYLVPSLAALAGRGVSALYCIMSNHRERSVISVLGAVAAVASLAIALRPHWEHNALVASWEEQEDTRTWVSYIQEHTAPDDAVMSDYPGLNFYAQRRTTPKAAGISRGAAKGGQITGAELIEEIETYDVKMVLLNVAHGSHQFVMLRDYETFKYYLQTNFYLAMRRKYDYRLLEVYAKEDLWDGTKVNADFGHQLELTGYRWEEDRVAPGHDLQVSLRWHGKTTMPEDYLVTLRLFDSRGHVWGMGSKRLVDLDKGTYWDERGLERAILYPTSQWPPGETTIQLFQLPVDPATPPGEYTARLRVHAEGRWNGLQTLDKEDNYKGYDFQIGHTSVIPAEDPPDPAALPIRQRTNTAVAPGLRLLGFNVSQERAYPGDTLIISTFWNSTADLSEDYTWQLALADGIGQTWQQASYSPVRSDLPTSTWRKGQILCGKHDFVVDAGTPAGEYALEGALLQDGDPKKTIYLGSITVHGRERSFEVPSIPHMLNAHFGDHITLLGYAMKKEAKAGDDLQLTLYWQADGNVRVSYNVFTHLVNQQNRLWGQKDGVPKKGDAPTTSWLRGEIIEDGYAIPVQESAPPGIYRVAVGMYDSETGLRLPCTNDEGEPLESDRILLAEVHVK
ncbi:MAG: glycosyltransferase family 39 protein, partial [Chloroflexota bacterium]|nr:glycosyltransferase family 39 protein [Chloroflexota bacterium]